MSTVYRLCIIYNYEWEKLRWQPMKDTVRTMVQYSRKTPHMHGIYVEYVYREGITV